MNTGVKNIIREYFIRSYDDYKKNNNGEEISSRNEDIIDDIILNNMPLYLYINDWNVIKNGDVVACLTDCSLFYDKYDRKKFNVKFYKNYVNSLLDNEHGYFKDIKKQVRSQLKYIK